MVTAKENICGIYTKDYDKGVKTYCYKGIKSQIITAREARNKGPIKQPENN